MNKDDFAQYLQAFCNADVAGFCKYYTEDVHLQLRDRPIEGRQGIADFYAEMTKSVRETLTPNQVIADEGGIAADLEMTFRAIADAPDFVLAPMKKGEVIRGRVFVFYTLRDGRICDIKVARAAELTGPHPE